MCIYVVLLGQLRLAGPGRHNIYMHGIPPDYYIYRERRAHGRIRVYIPARLQDIVSASVIIKTTCTLRPVLKFPSPFYFLRSLYCMYLGVYTYKLTTLPTSLPTTKLILTENQIPRIIPLHQIRNLAIPCPFSPAPQTARRKKDQRQKAFRGTKENLVEAGGVWERHPRPML